MLIMSHVLAIDGASVDHDTQMCHLSYTFILFAYDIFHGKYSVVIPDLGANYNPFSCGEISTLTSKKR